MVIFAEDPPPFIEGAIVILSKAARSRHEQDGRHDWTVESHAGGSVHVVRWANGVKHERNFSAAELEMKS